MISKAKELCSGRGFLSSSARAQLLFVTI